MAMRKARTSGGLFDNDNSRVALFSEVRCEVFFDFERSERIPHILPHIVGILYVPARLAVASQ
jgi:hypothetical protein